MRATESEGVGPKDVPAHLDVRIRLVTKEPKRCWSRCDDLAAIETLINSLNDRPKGVDCTE